MISPILRKKWNINCYLLQQNFYIVCVWTLIESAWQAYAGAQAGAGGDEDLSL